MNKQNPFSIIASLVIVITIAMFFNSCDLSSPDEEDNWGGNTTVKGTLILPYDVTGSEYSITIDVDGNPDVDGFTASSGGTCGSGTEIPYSIEQVPGGTYYIIVIVYATGNNTGSPQEGDLIGIYGMNENEDPPSAPNAVVPDSGEVTFNITLFVWEGDNIGENEKIRGNLILPAESTGSLWWVLVDDDLIGDNGITAESEGYCSSALNIPYSIYDIAAGTYNIKATVYVVGLRIGEPIGGDYYTVLSNIVVPSTGSVAQDITMVTYSHPEGKNSAVYGTLTLPRTANGKEISVYLDDDEDYSNGVYEDFYGMCGTSLTSEYYLNHTPTGTYKIRAMVHVVSTPGGNPVIGDFIGTIESAAVPATGLVTYNITLSVKTE
ncbi:MAG: hypothetical protein KKA84_10970 [Bacteroidetes bacterium]|nr:hypothetical protein [Bacteroidota bacterium]